MLTPLLCRAQDSITNFHSNSFRIMVLSYACDIPSRESKTSPLARVEQRNWSGLESSPGSHSIIGGNPQTWAISIAPPSQLLHLLSFILMLNNNSLLIATLSSTLWTGDNKEGGLYRVWTGAIHEQLKVWNWFTCKLARMKD